MKDYYSKIKDLKKEKRKTWRQIAAFIEKEEQTVFKSFKKQKLSIAELERIILKLDPPKPSTIDSLIAQKIKEAIAPLEKKLLDHKKETDDLRRNLLQKIATLETGLNNSSQSA